MEGCQSPLDGSRSALLRALARSAAATAKEERYLTANELAEDLARYLAGEPTLAKPPSLHKRLSKWGRRHRRAVLAAMAVCVCHRISAWILALPMVLFEQKSGREAMKASVQITARCRWKLVLWLVTWLIGVSLMFAFVLPALGGCVTATVQQVREASTGISDMEAIVVLGRKDRPSSDETEMNFVRCVGARMGKGGVVHDRAERVANRIPYHAV